MEYSIVPSSGCGRVVFRYLWTTRVAVRQLDSTEAMILQVSPKFATVYDHVAFQWSLKMRGSMLVNDGEVSKEIAIYECLTRKILKFGCNLDWSKKGSKNIFSFDGGLYHFNLTRAWTARSLSTKAGRENYENNRQRAPRRRKEQNGASTSQWGIHVVEFTLTVTKPPMSSRYRLQSSVPFCLRLPQRGKESDRRLWEGGVMFGPSTPFPGQTTRLNSRP